MILELNNIMIDGVRVGQTDLNKFRTEPAIRTWARKIRETYQYLTDRPANDINKELRELIDPRVEVMRIESEQRRLSQQPRNLNLVVVAKRERAVPIFRDMMAGLVRNCLYMFDSAVQMTDYEFDAYESLGVAECERQGIETLYDLFGTDFAIAFYARKNVLRDTAALVDAERELAEAQLKVDDLKRSIVINEKIQ